MDVIAVELAWAVVRRILPRRCPDYADGATVDPDIEIVIHPSDCFCRGVGWLYPDRPDYLDRDHQIEWEDLCDDMWKAMRLEQFDISDSA